MYRTLFFMVLAALAGCGFRLRGEASLPPDLSPLRLEVADPYSPLGRDLGLALERAGLRLTEEQPAATLRLLTEQMRTVPLTVGSTGRAQEYELRYVVEFEVVMADGAVRIARQRVELARSYAYDVSQATGAPGEQEIVRQELLREMVQGILRRIEAAKP